MNKQYIKTQMGTWEAIWSEQGLYELNFPKEDILASKPADARERELEKQLTAYCANQKYSFDSICVDFSDYTEFAVEVLKACRQIKHGCTSSYKGLAIQVGRDKAYRAVGSIMSNNRTPIIIPCHRVLGSSGKLCGFAGGLDMKSSLLEMEASR